MWKSVREVLSVSATASALHRQVKVNGWVRTLRKQKGNTFINLNDGSSADGVQIVVENGEVEKVTTGAAITVEGLLTKPQREVITLH